MKLNNQGETLVETLITLVIISISVLILLTSVTTSNMINLKAKNADVEFCEMIDMAERKTNVAKSDKVVIKNGTREVSIDVNVYGEGIMSYDKK